MKGGVLSARWYAVEIWLLLPSRVGSLALRVGKEAVKRKTPKP